MSAHSTRNRYQSWGRYPAAEHRVRFLRWRHEGLSKAESPMLPFGNGRSYGDSCLNDGGVLLDVRGLDRLISFDTERGILVCEAGVLLSEILDLAVPAGWFLPVSPGTKFVTVGGAIAAAIWKAMRRPNRGRLCDGSPASPARAECVQYIDFPPAAASMVALSFCVGAHG